MSIKRLYKYFIAAGVLVALLLITVAPSIANANANDESKRSVPFSEVEVDEGFFHNYMKLVICEVIPTAIENVEKPKGGMNNIKWCANWHNGGEWHEHEGALYVDSDVHKVLESMCMALDTPDNDDPDIKEAQNKIKKKLDEWIPYYQKAPEPEGSQYPGYFDTYWSLDTQHEKYSNTDQHELYCQGHFIEAAVAHYRYSQHKGAPDTSLLDVAVNSADHIVKTFGKGDGQRKQIPGHQEIELALMKLAKLCDEIGGDYAPKAEGYIDTAAFFLGVRGDYEGRTVDSSAKNRPYYQDHALVENQMEAVGHAVRAQYMYSGMCDLASIRPAYAAKYNTALTTLWDNVTNKKQYVTGGIGDQSNSNEGFAGEYYLPNYTSYCETCAGVANMLWNRSMSTLYDGSQYADQIETDLYNNVLGCVNFDGNKFYYENRLCTVGAFDRSSWFGTACCPPNYTRTILQVGGYVYNTTSDDIFVNQYISNKAEFLLNQNDVNSKVSVTITSNFPYGSNGNASGTMTVKPVKEGNFSVNLRKPSWAKSCTIKIGGTEYTTEKDGYIVINNTWSTAGTEISFSFGMDLDYVTTPNVETNEGLVALRHGPLFYCAEGCDNDANFDFNKASIDQGGNYSFDSVKPLDGMDDPYGVCSVSVLSHDGKVIDDTEMNGITWKLIPYYARCNRELKSMHVFLNDGNKEVKPHQMADASASFSSTTGSDSIGGLNDGTNDKDMRWTSWNGEEKVILNPWVKYNFDTPVKFNGFRIWWYDDNGGVRLPDDFSFEVKKNDNSNETVVLNSNEIVCTSNDDKFTTYMFPDSYEANEIKMTMYNAKSAHAVGIVEWEIVDANIQDISVEKQPNKTEYILGEDFDPTGMIIDAKYVDKDGKELHYDVQNYECKPSKLENLGKQDIEVSYTVHEETNTNDIQEITKTTIVSVNVILDPNNPGSGTPQTGDDIMAMLALLTIIGVALALLIQSGLLKKLSNK